MRVARHTMVVLGLLGLATAGLVLLGAASAVGPTQDGALSPAAGIPAAYVPLIEQAAGRYCDLPPELLAAVLAVESGFAPAATSPAGAQGLAQFLPTTWAAWGVDADGDGRADPFAPADAILSAARYLCALGAGDPARQRLAVAAYHAGPAAVQRHGGIPPYPETRAYVQQVFATAARYAAAATVDQRLRAVIGFAVAQIGTPYLWGGDGPQEGEAGFDCSGLTQAAYQQAGIRLPRTARAQYQASPRVPGRAALQPGDLLFWAHDVTDPGSIHHVAIYLGRDAQGRHRRLDAPRSGSFVQVRPVSWRGFIGATRPLALAGTWP